MHPFEDPVRKSDSLARNLPQFNEGSVAMEQARIMAEIQARQNAVQEDSQFIDRQGYRIGALQLLARFDATSELSELPPIYRIPGAPAGVKGLANLHGNVVPVFEIAGALQVTHLANTKPMLLVLGSGEMAAGVIIDGLPERKRFIPQDVVSAEEEHFALAPYSLGSYRDAAGVWTEIDAQRFFEDFTKRVN
jgi:twitching motility protein PilI